MDTYKTINLKELRNPDERKIVLYLLKHEQCTYGKIMKDLKLSYIQGQEKIGLLVSQGSIKFIGTSSNMELAVKII